MEALLKSTQSNLESVTETVISQTQEIEKLKAQLAELEKAKDKLETELSYANNMVQAYKGELNKTYQTITNK